MNKALSGQLSDQPLTTAASLCLFDGAPDNDPLYVNLEDFLFHLFKICKDNFNLPIDANDAPVADHVFDYAVNTDRKQFLDRMKGSCIAEKLLLIWILQLMWSIGAPSYAY